MQLVHGSRGQSRGAFADISDHTTDQTCLPCSKVLVPNDLHKMRVHKASLLVNTATHFGVKSQPRHQAFVYLFAHS